MSNRRIKADKIFDGHKFMHGKILELNAKGMITDILEEDGNIQAETFTGILTPGFVNCHCHLELSHLKDVIERKTGLTGFVQQVMKSRFFSKEKIAGAAKFYDEYMNRKGIAAVGDICNTTDTVEIKKESNIHYKNFVEATGFIPSLAETRMNNALQVYDTFVDNGLDASIVPHAPYSVSEVLFKKINFHSSGKIITIHNQETEAEDVFFKEKSGAFLDLYRTMKADISFFQPDGKSGIQTVLPYLLAAEKVLLVHNTFTTEEDIVFAQKLAMQNDIELYWVLCANANLYIEDKLPPVELLIKHQCKICLGTDSLSSNDDLDILHEIRTLKKYFSEMHDELLLKAACSEGASALGYDDLGRLRKDTQPGINLIDHHFNFLKKIY